MRSPASREQAMEELVEVVSNCREDSYQPIIVKRTDNYLYAQFVGPIFGYELWATCTGEGILFPFSPPSLPF